MKALFAAVLALCSGLAHGQTLDAPATFAPAAPAPHASGDPQEAPMMAMPSMEGTLQQWYAQQNRPPLVVYFDKRLDQLPPGWHGSSRLLIEESTKGGGKDENRRLTVGVQKNTQAASSVRNEFITLFEQSLQQEMRRQQFRVLDGVVLHRRLAAGNHSEDTDLEYESLKKSARFVFEVQLVVLNGQVALLANLKDIHTGDVTASLRLPVEEVLDNAAAIDVVNRQLVKHLLRQKAP